jgi:SNF2 family DNA or RNA helicase
MKKVIFMINLSLNDIRKTTNDLSFKRGVQYYHNGQVQDLEPNANTISSTVLGSQLYNVLVGFDDYSGNLSRMECTCPSHTNYSGACKHIVATLLEILYSKEKINLSIDKLSHQNIINAFSNALTDSVSPNVTKQPVYLDIIIEPMKESITATSLRIGTDKFYIVKDITKLLSAIHDRTSINFGKSFTFDPKIHYFDPTAKLILDLIKEYFDTYSFLKSNPYESKNIQLFNNFLFPDVTMKRLFNILKNKSFSLKYRGITYTSEITSHLPTMNFNVTQDENNITVKLAESYDYFPITRDLEYIFFEDQIYRLDNKERRFFSVVTQQFNNSLRSIILHVSYKQKLVSSILPVLKKLGTVKMDETMSSNLLYEDCVPHIYLDKYKNTIKGTLSFFYGDYKVGIYPPSQPSLPEDFIIVHNVEKEGEIYTLLSDASCNVDPSEEFFTIRDEDRLFKFIYTYLPKLQEIARIYYAAEFKNLQIRIPSTVSAGVRLNENSNMLEFSFNIEGIDRKELPQILKSIQEKKKYYRLKDGSFLQLEDSAELTDMADIMKQLNLKNKDLSKEVIEIPKYRAIYVDTLMKDSLIYDYVKNNAFEKLVQDIKDPSTELFELPDSLKATLRNYQKLGFQWLKVLSHYGFGGILADDMGLGKTLQAITLLKSIDPSKQSLVIAPTSLVYNWEDEINKFAPDLKVCVISGDKKIRAQAFEDIKNSQVIITSYGLLKRDLETYMDYNFEFCFIDEAQHIKNPNSLNAKSVKLIKASTRIALTGTPIENSLSELWSIFDFIMPGYLYSHSKFINNYEKPIIKGEDDMALMKLTTQIKPFILRRLKSDVLKELPPKIETKMTTELLDKQKKLYIAYLEKVKGEVKNEITSNGFQKSTIKILSALTRLRQICCHPALFADNYTGDSAKLELLEELVVDAIESGHRILIFSQFTSMLKLIQPVLEKNMLTYFYLDGATNAKTRRDMVNDFNAGQMDIFLISLKAGGTGLNLTGADMVIHYDPWWNPATEDQATDRAYRIGQDKPVQVIRLITAGTIEEKIYKLQQKKKSLIDSVIHPGETLINKLSEDEVMELLELKEE